MAPASAEEGAYARLQCWGRGAAPPAKLAWRVRGRPLHPLREVVVDRNDREVVVDRNDSNRIIGDRNLKLKLIKI